MKRRSFLVASLGLLSCAGLTLPAYAAPDKATFETILKEVIQAAAAKDTKDIDKLMVKLESAAKIGVEFCKDVASAEPKSKAILDFTVQSYENIRNTPEDKFEELWHEGAGFKSAGHDPASLDQTGKAASAMDAIIHPLTARAAFAAYKASPKPQHLQTVIQELEEALGHVKNL